MPANLTHQYFAKRVSPQLMKTMPFIKKYESILLLATQGPDPFFFYGSIPWLPTARKLTVQQHGQRLHRYTGHEALDPLFRAASSELEKTYAIGALLHYVLDYSIHPFVFYQSGFDQQGRLSPPYHSYHAHYETMMDISLRQQVASTFSLHPLDAFIQPRSWVRSISQLYHRAFPWMGADDFYHSTLHMHATTRTLYSPRGIKRSMLGWVGKKRYAYALSYTEHVAERERYDYLNLQNSLWIDPTTQAQSTHSVFALLDAAEEMLEKRLEILQSWAEGSSTSELLQLPAINYDGEPNGQPKMSHQSIYLKYKIL
jgi:hypothetical protein